MDDIKSLKIRPYARLLTMLGEQLIKNERIALIELIKNSYDADADWVKINFQNFGDAYEVLPDSQIIIEDNGNGMSADIIEKHWLNPATPIKKYKKQQIERTKKNRVIQGEKGIGRFAILKLGRKIRIISRAVDENTENVVDYDFSKYDDEFLTDNGKEKELYIDDLVITLQQRKPEIIVQKEITLGYEKITRDPKGTRIEISDLKGIWTEGKIEDIVRDLNRLDPIFEIISTDIGKEINESKFRFWIHKDLAPKNHHEEFREKLNILLNDRSVIRVENGFYDQKKEEFCFSINGNAYVLNLRDPDITGIKIFEKRFGKGGKLLDTRKTECGSFQFGFYVFDLSAQVDNKYKLDSEDKKLIKENRIYLYRDGIRVYPYGEPNDDWLRIDMDRGTISAGEFLSNDQVVGFVCISQKGNPQLQDKTNREGLIEQGNATEDFITLVRVLLKYIRYKPYERYRQGLKNKKPHDIFRTNQIQKNIDELREATKGNNNTQNIVTRLEKDYLTERKYLIQRAEMTEDLAGVGLSVETATHDVNAIMSKATAILDSIIRDSLYSNIAIDELMKELQSLRGMLSFIEAQLKDIQLLFKSSKQKRRHIKIREIIDKIERIYRRILQKDEIELVINELGSPLVAKTTDAVLLQLFLNLFDNSVYWLQQISIRDKKIVVTLDGNKGQMIFSDNGPGIKNEDAPYIFEPFYTGKGEEGKGLGLYIARQLLERNDYSIDLADLKSEKILAGANFVVSFITEDKKNEY